MRQFVISCCLAVSAVSVHISNAFTTPFTTTTSPRVNKIYSYKSPPQDGSFYSPILFGNLNSNDNDELVPSLQFIKATSQNNSKKLTKRLRIKAAGQLVLERMDTFKAAGLYDDDSTLVPMQSGFKSNVGLLVGAFLFKWYRARFINKIPVWDRQPQWNMVVTSPEQEKELHAYMCKKCGSTIFIARHREWFFKGGNTECTNCGATGKENFENIREDIIDSIDDDYFDYESPLDFVSAAERRKLVKQAGGDEELAKQMAIDNVMKNDQEQIQIEDAEIVSSSKDDDTSKKSSNDSGSAGKKTKKKKKKVSDDILDELDMDM